MKKFLSMILTTAMLSSCLPLQAGNAFAEDNDAISAVAEEPAQWEYEAYTYNNGTEITDDDIQGLTVTSYLGTQTDVYIPSEFEIDGELVPVLKLADGLFEDNENLNSATLGNGILEIGAGAFKNAINMVCILTPESLVSIGNEAFSGCEAFNSVILYDMVTKISDNAFDGCDNVVIYCNENSTAHSHAVENDIKFELMDVEATPEIVTLDGIEYYLMNGEAVIMSCPADKSGALVIPARVNNHPVTMINDAVFKNITGITSVELPDSIRYIGKEAFYGCTGMTAINVPAAVTAINESTFYGCTKLWNVSMPKGLKSIEMYAFYNCRAIMYIELPYGLTKIGHFAFYNCRRLVEAYMPESITELGNGVFMSCVLLQSNNIPDKITRIPESLFYGADFTEVEIPYGVTKIGNSAFYGVPLTEIDIPDTVTEIGYRVFYQSKLKKVYIPDSVTSMGGEIFYDCDELTEVRLSGSIEHLSTEFMFCDGLTEVTVPEGVTSMYGTFYGCKNLKKVTLPESLVAFSGNWSSAYGTFCGCNALTEISLPSNLKEIGASTFAGTAIESFDIPDGVKTIWYNAFAFSKAKEINLPASLTKIYSETFRSCTNLESITIPEGVTEISYNAFYGCTALKEVNLPNTLTTILYNVFENCTSLESITIPDSVTKMSQKVFLGCTNLKSVIISDNLANMFPWTFSGCTSLSYVRLPANLYSIDGYAFENCTSLKNIVIPASVKSINGAVFPMDTLLYIYEDSYAQEFAEAMGYSYEIIASIPEVDNLTFKIINGEAVVTDCLDTAEGEIIIPEYVQGFPVTKIGFNAFRNCTKITSIEIPDLVTVIEQYAFAGCSSLSSVNMSDNVTKIERYAFSRCSALKEISLPDSLLSLENDAFSYCNLLESVELSDNLIRIDNYTFEYCTSLKSVIMPAKLESIGMWAFRNCGLSSVDIPKSVTKIESGAFEATNLESVILPEGMSLLGGSVFESCKALKYAKLPESITKISVGLFEGCSNLEKVDISKNLQSIGAYAFWSCGKLKDITIPDTVESIGASAFVGCAFEDIKLPEAITVLESSVLQETSLKSITIPENVTVIGNNAFYGCTELEEIIWNDKVEEIGDYAFEKCTKLTSIKIPSTVKKLGKGSFNNAGMSEIIIPANVEIFADLTFAYAKNLEKITFEGDVSEIVNQMFAGCSNLHTIELPNTPTRIGTGAFLSCEKLTELTIPSSVETIEKNAFYKCSGLTNIYLPDGLTSIATNAFEGCSGLTEIIIPEGVTAINDNTFLNCTNLKKIVLPESVESIAVNAFEGCSAYNILWVYKDSYAHTYAVENNIPYFIIRKTGNPEILYGTLLDGSVSFADGNVAADVTVDLLYDDGSVKDSVTTNENGVYSFPYAEVGRYTVRATDVNGNTGSETVSVKRMNVFDVFAAGDRDIVIEQGYTVSGEVSDEADVILTDTEGNVIAKTTTSDKKYAISNVPNGTYIIKAEAERGSVSKEITVFDGDITVEMLIIPEFSATISGYVEIQDRDLKNHKKNWIRVTLYNSLGTAVDSVKTDDNGRYSFINIPADSYAIVAETEELRPDKNHGYDRTHKLVGYAFVVVSEAKEYEAETIVLKEENKNKTTVSGKVTAQGETQKCEVVLSDVFGKEVAKMTTGNNGKYTFKNVADGVYFITATTKKGGMGYAVIAVLGGDVFGETDIYIKKSDKIREREDRMKNIPDCDDRDSAIEYKDEIKEEKKFYDSLSDKEKKEFSKEYTDKLNRYSELISDCEYTENGGYVENGGLIISEEELESGEPIEIILDVEQKYRHEKNPNGLKSEEDYIQHLIEDTAGENELAMYYEITLTKNGKEISDIQKYTDTTGKLKVVIDIPEEYKGHKNYSFVHIHNGEAVTLADIDSNPDTVTFEIDRFSTFALTYTDEELTEVTFEKADIIYCEETRKISVYSDSAAKLYIATYDGEKLINVEVHELLENTYAKEYEFDENQRAFIWNDYLEPVCESFIIE